MLISISFVQAQAPVIGSLNSPDNDSYTELRLGINHEKSVGSLTGINLGFGLFNQISNSMYAFMDFGVSNDLFKSRINTEINVLGGLRLQITKPSSLTIRTDIGAGVALLKSPGQKDLVPGISTKIAESFSYGNFGIEFSLIYSFNADNIKFNPLSVNFFYIIR